MKRLAVAFTGPSGSGKTTAIIKISNKLKENGFKVCIVKHDPKDKAIFDKEGKDSFKFSNTGADVAVISPTRTTMFKKQTSTIDEIVDMFGDFDYLLVEGLKTLPLPRIAIFRNELNERYYEVSDTFAIDETVDRKTIPDGFNFLDLNDTNALVNWIDLNAKAF